MTIKHFAIPILLIFLLTGCTNTLKDVVDLEVDVGLGVAASQQSVEQLLAQGQITPQDAARVSTVLLRITDANKQAAAITRNIQKLDPNNTQALRDIVVPLIKAVNDGITQNVLPISNVQARTVIQVALAGLVTTLNVIASKLGSTATTTPVKTAWQKGIYELA